MRKRFISNSPQETINIAKELALKLKWGEVICLYGDLGAGKTVFAKGLIQYFLPNRRILSPTFIIVRHYQINHREIKRFIHVDLYRINDVKEIEQLEFIEFIHKSDTIIAIEWAERLGKFLPQKRIDIRLKTLSDYSRLIKIEQIHARA